jgi:HCO3- transporter family
LDSANRVDLWGNHTWAIITVLFFFDHEVSSIICTSDRYGTKKPGGFAWDVVLLGLTTSLCGVLGVPLANRLLPQAPLHSESLVHAEPKERTFHVDGEEKTESRVVRQVYEQRWSAFLHAGGILIFASPPFMHILGLTPTSVLAGLFLFMGEQNLSVNPILFSSFLPTCTAIGAAHTSTFETNSQPPKVEIIRSNPWLYDGASRCEHHHLRRHLNQSRPSFPGDDHCICTLCDCG